jgi:hypothetical protein
MNIEDVTYTPYIPVSESSDGIDWAHANSLDDEWYVDLVDPHDPNAVLGSLSNITAISITMGYYTDARMSAEVDTIGDDGLSKFPHARMRIMHKIASENYLEEIFTGYISDDPDSYAQSETTTKYSLISSLGALTDDKWTSAKYANVGDSVKAILQNIMTLCGRTYLVESTTSDYTFSSVVPWKAQSSILTTVIQLADYASDYVTVNGHGDIVLTKYVAPSAITDVKWNLNYDDASGIIVSSSISHTSTSRSLPGRYILECDIITDNSSVSADNPLIGVADANSGSEYSSATRGYMIASSETLSDFTGGQSEINTLAKARLANAQSATDEWSVTTLYAPMREGEIALFTKENTTHVCLIKSITADCIAKTMQVTLKGLG